MKRINLFLRWLSIVIVLASVSGCVVTPKVVRHGLGFDFIDDSPEAELLDYRYGGSKNPAASNTQEKRNRGKSAQQMFTSGEMLRGKELYVKWRLKSTDEVFEETVDLRSRLPQDILGSEIYFMVRGSQLYVYLITPQRRAKDEPPNGPSRTHYLKTITLYPDQQKR